jgi:AcrR family transcriptional regulator
MPRRFTEPERERIRAALIAAGGDLIGARGLRHTSVEDVARAAGISKGAFYLFFESKEALFFAIFAEVEAAYQADLLREVAQGTLAPRERLRNMLRRAFTHWRRNPVLGRLSQEDAAYLQRAAPPEQLSEARLRDEAFLKQVLAHLMQGGAQIRLDAAALTGLMRALFFVGLHEDEIGAHVYSQVLDVLIDGVVAQVVG